MAVRKLKLIWQQVHDSTNHLYQPWAFLNVDKPRKILSNNINSNELRNVFVPSSMPIISNVQSSMISTEQSPLINSQTLSKPSTTTTDFCANGFITENTTTTNEFRYDGSGRK
jgi:hypothetical protein